MPRDDEEILKLKGRIRELEEENEELKKKHARARGVPAEDLVAKMTGGTRTKGYKDLHDVTTKKGNRIEVKLSKIHEYRDTRTKRWTWDRILGPKKYDYLVLAGEKDARWPEAYPPDLEYVFFLVPQSAVNDINSAGDCVALNTNFKPSERPKQESSSTATWSARKNNSRTCRYRLGPRDPAFYFPMSKRHISSSRKFREDYRANRHFGLANSLRSH